MPGHWVDVTGLMKKVLNIFTANSVRFQKIKFLKEMPKPYYILSPAVNTPETGGAFPAVESYDDYDFNAPNSVHKLNFREFPGFIPDIRFKLAKGANLCDMMGQATIAAHGLLINEKLKKSFEQFNIVPHKFYSAKIEDHQGNLHDYFWMHLVWKDDSQFVDWSNSKFIIKRFSKIEGEIDLNSYKEYVEKSKEIGKMKMIRYTSLKLTDIPYQLFTVPVGTDIFIQQPLFQKLNGAFTGLSFTLIDMLS